MKDRRNSKLIRETMQFKLIDAVADLKNLKKKRFEVRRRIFESDGVNARKLRNTVKLPSSKEVMRKIINLKPVPILHLFMVI